MCTNCRLNKHHRGVRKRSADDKTHIVAGYTQALKAYSAELIETDGNTFCILSAAFLQTRRDQSAVAPFCHRVIERSSPQVRMMVALVLMAAHKTPAHKERLMSCVKIMQPASLVCSHHLALDSSVYLPAHFDLCFFPPTFVISRLHFQVIY